MGFLSHSRSLLSLFFFCFCFVISHFLLFLKRGRGVTIPIPPSWIRGPPPFPSVRKKKSLQMIYIKWTLFQLSYVTFQFSLFHLKSYQFSMQISSTFKRIHKLYIFTLYSPAWPWYRNNFILSLSTIYNSTTFSSL